MIKVTQVKPLIRQSQSFSHCVSNDISQSVNENTVNSRGRSSMKQYPEWIHDYSN